MSPISSFPAVKESVDEHEIDQVFTINLHHDGIFIASPLRYLQGDLKQITDIDFEGIKELKTDSDVEDFVRVGDEIEEFDDVDFHTEREENVVIKNLTTHDPFLNKLCGNNGMFRDYLDESVLETEGMRYEHPKQLKEALANYGVENGYQLWYARNDWRSLLVYCELSKSTPKSSKKGAKSTKIAGKSTKSVDGWLDGCRRIIGLDGCFLKHTCRGELHTALGRDANNQMYLIAWAVVKVENIKNWSWFLSLLHDDLNLQQGTGLTLTSDSHKGVASSTMEEIFYAKMDDLKYINLEAYEYLVARNLNSWCRDFFNLNVKCAAFENGISESYHTAILLQRSKPIITMLEDIRTYIMQRNWYVFPSAYEELEVICGDQAYAVNLSSRTCSCRLWQLSGVPCIHVVAGYMYLNRDPAEGVHFSYSQETCKQIRCSDCQGVGHNKASCENPSVPKPITIVKKVPGRRREPNVQYALAKGRGKGSRGGGRGPMGAESCGRGLMGAESGSRGPIGAKSDGRGPIGAESGGRCGMGSSIGATGNDNGGRRGRGGGRASMGGARGRRGGGRRGRRGGGRGSTSGLKSMDEYDIRKSIEDEYMQGLLDEQEDLRHKQEKEIS
nr:hypothetical protein [Tanacetum cinerariifolium]